MQSICTPCRAAVSMMRRCFSTLRRLISSMGASVGAAFVACMSPHLTVRGMTELFLPETFVTLHQNEIDDEAYAERDEPSVFVERVGERRVGQPAREVRRRRGPQKAGHDRRDCDRQ